METESEVPTAMIRVLEVVRIQDMGQGMRLLEDLSEFDPCHLAF